MSQIWKTPLDLEGDTTTTIEHGGREVLHAGLDANGLPCVWHWAPVVPSEVHTTSVVLIGTGVPVDGVLSPNVWGRHVGTFVYGPLVLHAFETVARP
jgi:hypothetical protein